MKKNIYFVSDAHLGSLAYTNDRYREQKLVDWLDFIKKDAGAIYLVGDVFDFWYEYKHVIPKGFVRLFGKLAELSDSGIDIHFFIGNHDMWTGDYFEKELGIQVHKNSFITEINGKRFYIAHGNGLGNNPLIVRFIEKIFHSKTLRFLYNLVHPSINMQLGLRWSKQNRSNQYHRENKFYGEEKENLVVFAKEYIKTEPIDYFIFGHRHILLNFMVKKNTQVIFLGDWITYFSYGIFDGENFSLEQFEIEKEMPQQ